MAIEFGKVVTSYEEHKIKNICNKKKIKNITLIENECKTSDLHSFSIKNIFYDKMD